MEEIAINGCKCSHFLCSCRSQYVGSSCLIDLQEYSVTLEDECIMLHVLQKYFKSSVIQCLLDWFVSKLNPYWNWRLLQCSPETLATVFSVIYEALTLHGNLIEVGRLQIFLTELSKYLLCVYCIKLVFIFQMHQLPLQKRWWRNVYPGTLRSAWALLYHLQIWSLSSTWTYFCLMWLNWLFLQVTGKQKY